MIAQKSLQLELSGKTMKCQPKQSWLDTLHGNMRTTCPHWDQVHYWEKWQQQSKISRPHHHRDCFKWYKKCSHLNQAFSQHLLYAFFFEGSWSHIISHHCFLCLFNFRLPKQGRRKFSRHGWWGKIKLIRADHAGAHVRLDWVISRIYKNWEYDFSFDIN